MPTVFVISEDWLLRVGVRAELRERGVEALGMESADAVSLALEQGLNPSALVLDSQATAASSPIVEAMAGRVPTVLIASRVEKPASLPAASVLNRPLRVGDVVDRVIEILHGRAA